MYTVTVFVPSEYPSVQAAIAAHKGVTLDVVVDAHLHMESLRLNEDIRIRSVDPSQPATLEGQHCITGGTICIEGVHLEGVGSSPTITVSRGRLRLKDCDVDAASAAFVVASGAHSVVEMTDCDLQNGDDVGIHIGDGAQLRALRVACGHTTDDVIVIQRGASATLEKCSILPGGQAGVWVTKDSAAEIDQCRFFQHPNNNIQVQDRSRVQLTNSTLNHGGISVCEHGVLEASQSTLLHANKTLLLVQKHSTVALKHCRLQGADFGVFVESDNRATLHHCLIQDCQYAALVSEAPVTAIQCCFMDSPQLMSTSTPSLTTIHAPIGVNCSAINNFAKQRRAKIAVPDAVYHTVSRSKRRQRTWRDRLLLAAIAQENIHMLRAILETVPNPKDLSPFQAALKGISKSDVYPLFKDTFEQLTVTKRASNRPSNADACAARLVDVAGAKKLAQQLCTHPDTKVLRWLLRDCHIDESGVLHSGATLREEAANRAVEVTFLLNVIPTLDSLQCGDSSLHVEHITSLILDKCGLTALPRGLFSLKHLRNLSVKHNRLPHIPPAIGRLRKLYTLSLRDNKLTQLPESIGDLSALLKLDISNNALQGLPESIGQLSQLRTLDAAHNALTALPDAISGLRALHQLWLSHNRLTAIPQQVRHLSSLQSIHCYNNPITAFPTHVLDLPNLAKLDLQRSNITAWPEGSRVPEQLALLKD